MFVGGFGSFLYSIIEICFRGYTHWTMFITGGIAFLSLYFMNLKIKTKNILVRCLASCAIITFIELVVGCIVNKIFHMGVWDYSHRKLNLFGQICPLYSFFWFLLSLPATFLCFVIKNKLRSKQKDSYLK